MIWHPRGARTRACRVETRLDAKREAQKSPTRSFYLLAYLFILPFLAFLLPVLAAQTPDIPRLKSQVEAAPSAIGYMDLGQALLQANRGSEAEAAFGRALDLTPAGAKKPLGYIYYHLALAAEKQDRLCEAVQFAKSSLRNDPQPFVIQEKRRLDVAYSKLTAQADDLTHCLARALEADGPEASIDTYIYFDTDRFNLDSRASGQTDLLGEALSARENAGRRFLLVGHTDIRGTTAHNERLSLQRAQSVAVRLMEAYPALAGRIDTKGRGSQELKAQGTTEDDHALNRRVEVRFAP
jgi:outer membrane protein OmpA-like peptidoglycan-associated protein